MTFLERMQALASGRYGAGTPARPVAAIPDQGPDPVEIEDSTLSPGFRPAAPEPGQTQDTAPRRPQPLAGEAAPPVAQHHPRPLDGTREAAPDPESTARPLLRQEWQGAQAWDRARPHDPTPSTKAGGPRPVRARPAPPDFPDAFTPDPSTAETAPTPTRQAQPTETQPEDRSAQTSPAEQAPEEIIAPTSSLPDLPKVLRQSAEAPLSGRGAPDPTPSRPAGLEIGTLNIKVTPPEPPARPNGPKPARGVGPSAAAILRRAGIRRL